MIDWNKPIECKATNWKHLELRFVGVDPFNPEKVVICIGNGNTYKANKITGQIAGDYLITNKLKPWEEAFEKCFKGTSMHFDTNIEEAFHEGFEAGLTYALGTVK